MPWQPVGGLPGHLISLPPDQERMLMALCYGFLIERAEQAAQEAAFSLLENVRERALRSERAWRTMANQVIEVARNREFAQQARLVSGQWHGATQ